MLGRVYGALADLEDKAGDRRAAAGFQERALGYGYRAGNPEDCAIRHHNLANTLRRAGADAGLVLAHRLAAAIIFAQTGSGHLATVVRNLANSDLPPAPPPFAEVVERVEQIPGVRFGELAERLAGYSGRGSEEALAQVWQLVQQEKETQEQQAGPDMDEVLKASEPLLQAIAAVARGEEGELSRAEIEEVLAQLEEKGWMLREPVEGVWAGERDEAALTAGLDPNSAQLVRRLLAILAAADEVLETFEPLLQDIAAVARGEEGELSHDDIEKLLPQLEEKGWMVREPVERIWAGERDEAALTAGLDPNSARLVRRILAILASE